MRDRGERGPKGDHGQPGDTGDVGLTGPIGERGESGIRGERGPEGETPKSINRSFIAVVVVSVLALGILGYDVHRTRSLAEENQQSNVALCALRSERIQDVERTSALLEEHPGPLVFGIPRSLIVAGRDQDQRTVDILQVLDCPPNGHDEEDLP